MDLLVAFKLQGFGLPQVLILEINKYVFDNENIIKVIDFIPRVCWHNMTCGCKPSAKIRRYIEEYNDNNIDDVYIDTYDDSHTKEEIFICIIYGYIYNVVCMLQDGTVLENTSNYYIDDDEEVKKGKICESIKKYKKSELYYNIIALDKRDRYEKIKRMKMRGFISSGNGRLFLKPANKI